VLEKNRDTGIQQQEVGRSKGGFTTKLHAACDALGNPIRFFITPGQRSDYTKALDLIDGQVMQALLADKGYNANYMIEAPIQVGAGAVIPPSSIRKTPGNYDSTLYKERNLIERMFNKLKNFRRVATRYDKLSIAYPSFVAVAALYL
jgi:transposase